MKRIRPPNPLKIVDDNVGEYLLIDICVDPKWKDVVISGYGISTKDVKRLHQWTGQALKYIEQFKDKR